MRSSEGVIEKRGRNRFRSRITIRGRAHSKTFSQLAQAEQWLLDLQLSTGKDDLTHRLHTDQLSVRELIERFRDEVAERRASPESRCRPLCVQHAEPSRPIEPIQSAWTAIVVMGLALRLDDQRRQIVR